MPKVDKVKLDLNTAQGKWMHALNSLYFYDQKPKELNEAVFDKLFRQAELAQLTPEQDLAYERSMKVYFDTYQEIEGGRILGHNQGLAEGKELGLAEGKKIGLAEGEKIGVEKGKELGIAEAKRETAQIMRSMGIDEETIRMVTGLSDC